MEFSELYDKIGKGVVVLGVELGDQLDEEIKGCSDYFRGIGFYEGEILSIEKIENIKKADSRVDVFVELADFQKVEPLSRIKTLDIKWVENYISAYEKDFGAEVQNENS